MPRMGAKRKSYTPKYRQDAARLVIDTQRTIAEVAREIGVGEQLLGRWVAIERARMDDPPEALDINERAELERLRREVVELRMDREFLKKSGLLHRGELEPERAFELIAAEKATYEVTRMVELLGVSRSGFYAWQARQSAQPGPRASRAADLLVKIKVAHDASDGVNGAPRITADLRDAGEVVSEKTVAKLMRQNNIRGISPRPWTPITTISDERVHAIPDLVARRFDQGALNLVWTSDITYLATREGWLYLCAVRDGCSRRVLGYAFADSLHTDIVETALRRAVTFRDPATGSTAGVIFHADRGCQYTSAQLAEVADEVGVRLSVGRTGVCWDNSQIESFWSTLKTEFYTRHEFTTRAEAIAAVSTWIETVYNRRRRHSALGQISPVTFENRITTAAEQAA
ncbi:IS3 family transposase [Nostocoides australiense]|uniref:IS3 family transposase n=1 Tax=Nostocoides australiense TaxID=99480 RepID=UPI0012EE5778|nr:IS3 family transposase [Tetrasphaera australiensis]